MCRIRLTIPKGVEVIKESAFAGNQLTEITINANNVTFGSNALPDAFVASYVRNNKKADTYYSFYYNHRIGWENTAERARRPVEEETRLEQRREEMKEIGYTAGTKVDAKMKKQEQRRVEAGEIGYRAGTDVDVKNSERRKESGKAWLAL